MKVWKIALYALAVGPWTFVLLFSIYYFQIQNYFGHLPRGGAQEIGLYKWSPLLFNVVGNAFICSFFIALLAIPAYFLIGFLKKKNPTIWLPIMLCFIGNTLAVTMFFSPFFAWYID